jgi:hypothetical protein
MELDLPAMGDFPLRPRQIDSCYPHTEDHRAKNFWRNWILYFLIVTLFIAESLGCIFTFILHLKGKIEK